MPLEPHAPVRLTDFKFAALVTVVALGGTILTLLACGLATGETQTLRANTVQAWRWLSGSK